MSFELFEQGQSSVIGDRVEGGGLGVDAGQVEVEPLQHGGRGREILGGHADQVGLLMAVVNGRGNRAGDQDSDHQECRETFHPPSFFYAVRTRMHFRTGIL